MRRRLSLFLAFVLIFVCMLTPPTGALASDEIPSLVAISFKNARLDVPFSEDNQDYSITLDDNTVTPTLEKYGIRGNADLFINYVYDDTNHQIGVTATLQYELGTRIYNFTYSNPATYVENNNNKLSAIYSQYAELSPAINDSDTSYKMYIPSDLKELTVTPVTSDVNAYCAPVTLILTEDQAPKITLSCRASNGSVRNYVITIKRVNKTCEEVKQEMAQEDYESFVTGTRLHETPEFLVGLFSVLGGILIIILLFSYTRRITVNPIDSDEVYFFDDAEDDETETE